MKWWVIGIGLSLLSCTNDKQSSKVNTDDAAIIPAAATVKINEEANTAESPLSIETFSTLPGDIKSCNAVYASGMAALDSSNYILASNLKGKAYIKVNDRLVALKLDERMDEGSITKEIYKGSGYMVHVISHKVKKVSDDAWLYAGDILIFKDNDHESEPIVGTVGCAPNH